MGFVNIEATIILSKVMIGDLSLPEHCSKNGYDFDKIVEGYVRQRRFRSLDNRDEKELAIRLMENQDLRRKHPNEIRITIYGMTTAEFAELKEVPVKNLRKSLTTGHISHPEKTYEELADEFVIRYRFKKNNFSYYGMSLKDVQDKTGIYIPVKDVQEMYAKEYYDKDDRPFQDICNEIVDKLLGFSIKKLILERKRTEIII